ncbi:RidA family protein [Photorhabdus sp. CRCIA-P01]|uniref:RidA family protein n=1 Tax=Photorhabdus sp. CRCIA-P01 TaxID=2019570 RepID=UPI000E59E116|nr:RidA family protein [Photorhabdus sp. CRCIA-P01]
MSESVRFFESQLPFPFSVATEVNGVLYLSGQVSITGSAEPVYGSITTQTANILRGISKTLAEMDSGFDRIFRVTVWLSDMKHFSEFNQEYARWFSHRYPARTVTGAQLAFGLDVEIEVQALTTSLNN